jgi:nucleoside-diphosphate-sugar epimerase
MNILIVGGAGEVGRYLIEDFTQKGHILRILDLAPSSPEMGTNPGLTYFQGNLTDKALVQNAVEGCDAIINLAWSFSDEPQTIFGSDITGTANLLDAALKSGVSSVIYASTAVVYGRAVRHPVTEEHPCLIEEARKPFYALGKYAAEKLCLLYFKERGLPVSILRFWWAFGKSIGGRHLREIIKTAREHRPISMVRGAGGAFVAMSDLASAVSLIIGSPAAAGQTYNAGSLFLTWEEIGKMIIDLTSSSSAIQLVPSAEWQGPAFLNEVWDLSWDKAAEALGYQPQLADSEARGQFREALKECVVQLKQ